MTLCKYNYKPKIAILACLFIAIRAMARPATTAARSNTQALLGPLPTAAALDQSFVSIHSSHVCKLSKFNIVLNN